MTRRILAPIEVVEGPDGDPVAFRWRGRRYAVTAVIARWVEALPWWVDGASGQTGDRATGPLVHQQRQVWRVEAASRSGIAGVYDLGRRRRPTPGGWILERVLD